MHSTRAIHDFKVVILSGDFQNPTPFEARAVTTTATTEDWTYVELPLSAFGRADYAPEGGIAELDAARIAGIGFEAIAPEAGRKKGIIRIDDVTLLVPSESYVSYWPADEMVTLYEFEDLFAPWSKDTDSEWDRETDTGTHYACKYEDTPRYALHGRGSLSVGYRISEDGYARCMNNLFEPVTYETVPIAIRFMMHSNLEGDLFNLILLSGDPEEPTRFVTPIKTTLESREEELTLVIPITAFQKAEWDTSMFPEDVVSNDILGFGVEVLAPEEGRERGIIWLDRVQLLFED